jgi:hypothetical protein
MLDSTNISRRQSEIRQSLAELAAKPEPAEDELRSMDTLDREYRANETRFRAALIAEDSERRDAGAVAWAARALQLSGAADLLRPYRELGSAA